MLSIYKNYIKSDKYKRLNAVLATLVLPLILSTGFVVASINGDLAFAITILAIFAYLLYLLVTKQVPKLNTDEVVVASKIGITYFIVIVIMGSLHGVIVENYSTPMDQLVLDMFIHLVVFFAAVYVFNIGFVIDKIFLLVPTVLILSFLVAAPEVTFTMTFSIFSLYPIIITHYSDTVLHKMRRSLFVYFVYSLSLAVYLLSSLF